MARERKGKEGSASLRRRACVVIDGQTFFPESQRRWRKLKVWNVRAESSSQARQTRGNSPKQNRPSQICTCAKCDRPNMPIAMSLTFLLSIKTATLTTGWSNVTSGNWNVFYAVWEIYFYFLVWPLSNSIWNTSISGVESSWTSLYILMFATVNLWSMIYPLSPFLHAPTPSSAPRMN